MANLVQFGTLDLSEATSDWGEANETRLNSMQVPKRHGVLVTEVPVMAGRVVRIQGRITADSYAVLRGSIDTMARILNSGRQKLRISDDRYINAFKQSFSWSYVSGSALRAADFTVDFMCDDPFWYDNAATTYSTTLTSSDTPTGGGNYKKSFQFTNGGEAFVYLSITVTADQGGAVNNVIVRNTTSGKTFTYTGNILASKALVVDSGNFTVKNDGADDLANWGGYFITMDKCTCTFEIEGKPASYLFSMTQRYY